MSAPEQEPSAWITLLGGSAGALIVVWRILKGFRREDKQADQVAGAYGEALEGLRIELARQASRNLELVARVEHLENEVSALRSERATLTAQLKAAGVPV